MPDIARDLRSMISVFGDPVILPNGKTVQATPGTADITDTVGCESIVAGVQRSLTFLTVDVPGIKERDVLRWDGRAWKVAGTRRAAIGAAIVVFLTGVDG